MDVVCTSGRVRQIMNLYALATRREPTSKVVLFIQTIYAYEQPRQKQKALFKRLVYVLLIGKYSKQNAKSKKMVLGPLVVVGW